MKKHFSLFILMLLIVTKLFAQIPSNDDCNGAITLTSQTTCIPTNGTVDNATADNFPVKATCDNAATSLGAGVFYKFTTAAATETIKVTPTGTLDAIIVLYNGANCSNLNEVSGGCIDQTGGNGVVTTLTINNLSVGSLYYIRVYDYGAANATSGGFTICVTHASPPSNDNCAGAITLTSQTTCNPTEGTVDNATADNFPVKATCDNATTSLGAGVFYKFTAVTATETIKVTPTGTLDAIIVLYSGTNCNNLNEVSGGCIDQAGGNGVVTTLTVSGLTVGNQYIIRVYDYGVANAASGGFTICVTHCTLPAVPSGIENLTPSACESTTAYVNLGALGADPAVQGGQWVWYKNSCSSDSVGTGPSLLVRLAQPGTTTYYLRARNSCGYSNCVNTTVTVKPLPQTPVITQNGNTLSSTSAPAYQWYDSNGPISGATQQTYTPTQNGNYTVMTTENGCSATSAQFSFISVGLQTIATPSLLIYPNPTSDKLRINMSGFIPTTISIYGMNGNRIREEKYEDVMDVSKLNSGVYLIIASGQYGEEARGTFVKQ